MAGNQGHNKGDKKSAGKFQTVVPLAPKPPTPAHNAKSVSKSTSAPKTSAKVATTSKVVDYSTWERPDDMEPIRETIWQELTKNGIAEQDFHYKEFVRRIAKTILPDLSDTTPEQMDILTKRLRSFLNHELSQIAHVVTDEKNMRVVADNGKPGVSDLASAENRLEEKLRNQNAGYTAAGIIQIRLEGVQSDLADPTCWNVTVKVPSGYEIAVPKPDARAILISMGIKPAETKPYIPVWAPKS